MIPLQHDAVAILITVAASFGSMAFGALLIARGLLVRALELKLDRL